MKHLLIFLLCVFHATANPNYLICRYDSVGRVLEHAGSDTASPGSVGVPAAGQSVAAISWVDLKNNPNLPDDTASDVPLLLCNGTVLQKRSDADIAADRAVLATTKAAAVAYVAPHVATHDWNGSDCLDAVTVILAGGPSTAVTGTSPTLFSPTQTVTPVAGARYEFEASGPLSTPLLGSSFALAIRVGNVNVVAASPISVAGSLANVGWWMRGRLHFQTLTAVDADIMVQTVSALGTAQTALKSTTQAVVVPSGAQVWGVETTFGSTGASATANGLTIKRAQ